MAHISRGPWRNRAGRNLPDEVEKAFKADVEETHGPSPIWDVIYETVETLATQPHPCALLLLSDGRGTGNSRSIQFVADFAAQAIEAAHLMPALRKICPMQR